MKPVWVKPLKLSSLFLKSSSVPRGTAGKTGLQKPEREMKPEIHLTFIWKDQQLKSAYCLQLPNAQTEPRNKFDINEWRKKPLWCS